MYDKMHPLNQSWTIAELILTFVIVISVFATVLVIALINSSGCYDNSPIYTVYSISDNTIYYTNEVQYTESGVKFIDTRTELEVSISDYKIIRN